MHVQRPEADVGCQLPCKAAVEEETVKEMEAH